MAKRSATSELNHDNWDAEEEKEEPGIFKSVGQEELQNRVIRKAKRSLGNVSILKVVYPNLNLISFQ